MVVVGVAVVVVVELKKWVHCNSHSCAKCVFVICVHANFGLIGNLIGMVFNEKERKKERKKGRKKERKRKKE